MAQKTIRLDSGASAVISWDKNWANLKVAQKDEICYTFADKDSLRLGAKIALANNETVYIRLMNDDLEAWHNGREIVSNLTSGSSDHFKIAIQMLWGVGGIILLIGIMCAVMFLPVNEPAFLAATLILPFIGIIYIALGFWAKIKKVKTPLYIAVILSLIWVLAGNIVVIGLIAGLIFTMYRGIKAPIINYTDEEQVIDENTPLDQI